MILRHRNTASLLTFCSMWVLLHFTLGMPETLFAQSSTVSCDTTVKQLLFLVDVSGSMETNDRLTEVKQFALRTVKERAGEQLLYKLISFGGTCNDIQTDVDWTRDIAVINAGIKGLYLRGGTPLGSALEYTIDAIKKSAYPDQTHVFLLNDGANACGDVQEILTRRLKEIPCVAINVVGIELQDDENNLADRARTDAEAISKATKGTFFSLNDVRELRGGTFTGSTLVMRPVEFEPRKKPQPKALAANTEKPVEKTTEKSTSNPSSKPAETRTSSEQNANSAQTSSTPAQNSTDSQKTSVEQRQSSGKEVSRETPRDSTKQEASEPVKQTSSKTESTKEPPKEPVKESPTTSQKTASQEQQKPPQEKVPEALPKQETQKQTLVDKESPKEKISKKEVSKEDISTEKATKKTRNQKKDNSKPKQQSGFQAYSEQTASNTQGTKPDQPNNTSTQAIRDEDLEEGIIIYFLPKSVELLPSMKQGLERLAAKMRNASIKSVAVDGHSSTEGSSDVNLRLSLQRASVVAAFLRQRLDMKNSKNIVWNAYGELRPVSTNDNEVGRQENRRVEVRIIR